MFRPSRRRLLDQSGAKQFAAGKVREALRIDRGLIDGRPNDPLPHIRMAYALMAAGVGEEARAEALKATVLAPKSALAFSSLGWMLQCNANTPAASAEATPTAVVQEMVADAALNKLTRNEIAKIVSRNGYANQAEWEASLEKTEESTGSFQALMRNSGFTQTNLADNGNEGAARNVLDWKRDLIHKGGGDDPLNGPLLARAWTSGESKGPEAVELASASLIAHHANIAAQTQGDFGGAGKFLHTVLDGGQATSDDYNFYGWNALFERSVDADAIQAAQQANSLSNNRSFADLHTLACG